MIHKHIRRGTGKSVETAHIAAYLRSKSKICLICASTTLSANGFEGAETTHYTFAYPVEDENDDDDEKPKCQLDLKKYEDRKALLMATDAILWDECYSNNRYMFEAIHEAMELNNRQQDMAEHTS